MNIEEHVVQSSSGKYSRHVWLLNDDNEKDQKLCVFLDAEYYLNHLQAPRVIEDLRRQGILPAVTCIFVSCLDAEARHYDYTCNDQYSDFIAHDILRWAEARVTGVSLSDNLIWVVARMRLIGRTRFDECKHPGRASLVGSRAANYRALFWLPDAFEPLPLSAA